MPDLVREGDRNLSREFVLCDRGDVSATNRVWLRAACAISFICKFQLIYGHIRCLLTLASLKFWERKRCLLYMSLRFGGYCVQLLY